MNRNGSIQKIKSVRAKSKVWPTKERGIIMPRGRKKATEETVMDTTTATEETVTQEEETKTSTKGNILDGLTYNVEVTLMEDMLGTASGDPEIYKNFIASKAEADKDVSDELETIIDVENEFAKNMTVFHKRETETGQSRPIIYDYLVKGFFKNACSVLRNVPDSKSSKIKAYKKFIDGLVFIDERQIDINLSGPMTICERPLRASTAQGERIALAASESVPAGSTMRFTIRCLNKTVYDCIPEWMDYGKYNGLGQWHNSGKGRFTWRIIAD